ncbi:MAG: PQQ-dependent sugar dehydrogenase [Parasphingorhabdus sp.]|uniref:PQQ-dependent sugar dehydrogenase n=1 Tax=Parasphingorhabdus sp. TaxID=2709688 RepID=UPI003299E8CD
MRRYIFTGLVLSLTACGGGGDSSSPVVLPPSVNSPPQITTGPTANVAENETAVLTVQATDADGDGLSFSISGGDDGDDFSISAGGVLSFASQPNFELPTDADRDNVYRLRVQVSDGSASDTLEFTVTVNNDREGIGVRRIATGMNDVTAIATIPSQAKVFVAQRNGNIYELDTIDGTRVLDRTVLNVNTVGEGGLLGLAVDPSFSSNNSYWAFVTAARTGIFATAGSDITIRKINRTIPEGLLGTGTQLQIPHASDSNYGGWLGFDPDNNLYIMVGDSGNSNLAQDPNSKLGKVLRLQPNPDPFAGAAPAFFLVPAGNPFAAGGGDPFVFALGVQDPKNGFLFGDGVYFGDRGSSVAEEINFLLHTGSAENFGWPFFEGSSPFMGSSGGPLVMPVTEYARGNGDREGSSIVGGAIYEGPVQSLQSKYIFADFANGNIWAVSVTDLLSGEIIPSSSYELLNADFEPDVGSIDAIVAIGTDQEKNLIIADSDGEIFVVEPA